MPIHKVRHHREPLPLQTVTMIPQASDFIELSRTVRLTRMDVHFIRSFERSNKNYFHLQQIDSSIMSLSTYVSIE